MLVDVAGMDAVVGVGAPVVVVVPVIVVVGVEEKLVVVKLNGADVL